MAQESPSGFVDTKTAARYIGMSSQWMRIVRTQRGQRMADLPAFYRLGRSVRYRISDLDAWLERQRVTPR